MKFRYTILYVKDVAATIDFYHRAFGLEKKMIHESGDYGELNTGATSLAFSSIELMKQLGKSPGAVASTAPVFETGSGSAKGRMYDFIRRWCRFVLGELRLFGERLL